jgi:hypothetical protein
MSVAAGWVPFAVITDCRPARRYRWRSEHGDDNRVQRSIRLNYRAAPWSSRQAPFRARRERDSNPQLLL